MHLYIWIFNIQISKHKDDEIQILANTIPLLFYYYTIIILLFIIIIIK